MVLKFLVIQFVLYKVFQLILGETKWVLLLNVLLTIAYFLVNLVLNQESMLYVPNLVPADHPLAGMTPTDEGKEYEDVYLQTADGLTIHAWFISATSTWTEQTINIHASLETSADTQLGIDFGAEGDKLVITGIHDNSVVAEWNSNQPEKRLLKGDVVLEVNGTRGDSSRLLQEIGQGEILDLKMQRIANVQRPTLLYLHENAGSISLRVPNFSLIVDKLGVNIFALDYRGYGKSQGTPSENGLIEDALCAWQWIQSSAKDGKLDGRKVFVIGKSLGGAVAAALVSTLTQQEGLLPQGLILENTFVSISAMVDSLFPFLAYESLKRRFLRLQWRTIDRIKDISVPLLFISGAKDEVVPPWHMEKLHSAAVKAEVRKKLVVPEGMHNDTWMQGGDEYWKTQTSFLQECCEGVGDTFMQISEHVEVEEVQ